MTDAVQLAMLCHAHEQARLHRHFHDVLGELSARDVRHLAAPERTMRERLIGELARYARAGRFPRNPDFVTRTPYFIDASGTRCAMAHLIEATGERRLVAQVAATRNNAYVRELAGALAGWLKMAGLTAAEAARIQPAYCFESKADACLCNSVASSGGVLETTVTGVNASQLTVTVDHLHGVTGTIAVGQTIMINGTAQAGSTLLVPVSFNAAMAPVYGYPLKVTGSEIELGCEQEVPDVPNLSKTDAINAILIESCATYLSEIDDAWADSQCEESDKGCSATGGGAPLLGAALVAALWARRRR